jgi:hypothetical protein
LVKVKEITDTISKTKTIKVLRLEGNTIAPLAAAVLGKALENHPEIERFIGNDIFTGRLKDEIPLSLVNFIFYGFCGNFFGGKKKLDCFCYSRSQYVALLRQVVHIWLKSTCQTMHSVRSAWTHWSIFFRVQHVSH